MDELFKWSEKVFLFSLQVCCAIFAFYTHGCHRIVTVNKDEGSSRLSTVKSFKHVALGINFRLIIVEFYILNCRTHYRKNIKFTWNWCIHRNMYYVKSFCKHQISLEFVLSVRIFLPQFCITLVIYRRSFFILTLRLLYYEQVLHISLFP
jgi:hypothetical protein